MMVISGSCYRIECTMSNKFDRCLLEICHLGNKMRGLDWREGRHEVGSKIH